MAALLDKLARLVSSRTDLRAEEASDEAESSLVHVHPSLKDGDLQDVLQHILEEPSYLRYRGTVFEDLSLKSMLLLLSAQGIHRSSTPHSMELVAGVLDSHLVLDRTASDAIHLFPPPAQVGSPTNTNSSLYGILNRCRTQMGARELRAWLRQPLVVLQEIQQRQDAVALLLTKGDRIRDEGLAAWPDVDTLAVKLESYKQELTGPTSRALECLYKLHLLAGQQVPLLYDALQDTVGDTQNDLLKETQQGLKQVLEELSRSQQLVEAVLDLEEAPRNFLVKATYSQDMQDVKQEIDGLDAELDDCLEDMNNKWAAVSGQEQQVRLEESGEWQFRLPNTNDSKLLQAQFKGVTIHRMLKNGVYFSTKELRQLGTKKQDLMAEYDKHQRQIVVDAMGVAASYVPVLERTSALVARLDVLCSLANVAAYSPTGYCRPTLTDGEEDGLGIEVSDIMCCILRVILTPLTPSSLSICYLKTAQGRPPSLRRATGLHRVHSQ